MNKDDINKFHLAVEQGDIYIVISCLETLPSLLDSTDSYDNTALMKAAFCKQPDIVRYLLAKGAAVDLANGDGVRALSTSIHNEDIEITEMLLTAKAEVNYIDGQDRSPLIRAVEIDEDAMIPMLEMLVKYGADVNLANSRGTSPLHSVGISGNIAMCNFLIDAGANTFSSRNKLVHDAMSATPLTRAILNRRKEIAKILIEKGGLDDIDRVWDESSKITAAGRAIQQGEVEIVQFLISKCSKLAQDPAAIILAAREGCNEVVELLLSNHPDINARDSKGNTALMIAIYMGKIDVVLTLLENGADLTISNQDLTSALILLVAKPEILKKALATSRAAEIIASKIDDVHSNILLYAAANGFTGTVSVLMEAGVDIEHENGSQDTALTLSVWGGRVEVVKALIDAGANIHHANIHSKTALALALQNYNNTEFAISQPSKVEKAKQVANLLLNKMDEVELAEHGQTVFMK